MYDASNAECLVFSYKDGLLSALAHDLKIKVEQFSIEVDRDTLAIEARFAAASLRPVCARVDGRDDQETLSPKDKDKIYANITKDVLHADRYPQVTFVSSSVDKQEGGYRVRGTLGLHGQSRELEVVVQDAENHWFAKVPIYQPHFGIKPFTAAFGALKIKPTVEVTISAPHLAGVG